MRPSDVERADVFREKLISFSVSVLELKGIRSEGSLTALLEQIVESLRRVEYIKGLRTRAVDSSSVDPSSAAFDPQKAALHHFKKGETDEAFWLVFLITHFGRHRVHGWGLLRRVYRGMGAGQEWTWGKVSSNVQDFRHWLASNVTSLKPGNKTFGFGNHRKYQSIDAWSGNGTGEAIDSYVRLIGSHGDHASFFSHAAKRAGKDKKAAFEILYRDLGKVTSFGRTARFDYLTMAMKLGFLELVTPKLYLGSSTGPIFGARLLIDGKKSSQKSAGVLEQILAELASHIGVDVDILEDALCNWQKSPSKVVRFRG
jgi:hypothetical protein